MPIAIILLTIIFLLFFLDSYLYNNINKNLKNKNSQHYERVSSFVIDWEKPFPQGCEFKYIYHLYPYQTCFFRGKRKELDGVNSSLFIVTGPPKLFPGVGSFFNGRSQESRRFKMPVRTDASVEVFQNGSITGLDLKE